MKSVRIKAPHSCLHFEEVSRQLRYSLYKSNKKMHSYSRRQARCSETPPTSPAPPAWTSSFWCGPPDSTVAWRACESASPVRWGFQEESRTSTREKHLQRLRVQSPIMLCCLFTHSRPFVTRKRVRFSPVLLVWVVQVGVGGMRTLKEKCWKINTHYPQPEVTVGCDCCAQLQDYSASSLSRHVPQIPANPFSINSQWSYS